MMIEKYICRKSSNISDAMKLIDKNSVGLVYIVDEDNTLEGCLTDGDIRRWIIAGGSLNSLVNEAMNHEPRYVFKDELSAGIEKMSKEMIYSLAVVDHNMRVEDIIFLESHMKLRNVIKKNALVNTPVIIMAGGKGTRLYPYTKILPKPLIPIGDIPILERILNRFADYGAKDFYLTVNYKREMIKSYFAESHHSYIIHYIEEDEPMGTAGGIRLIEKKFKVPIIISNCDILVIADYGKIMDYHCNSENDITVVSSLRNTIIPYGVLHTKEQGIITSMEEKPQLSHFINTGMYIVNPEFLNWIPENKVFHMTDLVQMMMDRDCKVGMYPISEDSFLDMGQFEELRKMEERINGSYVE